MRRRKDVSNRSASFTYLLRRSNEVSAWSATSRSTWDLIETSPRRRMPGGLFYSLWGNVISPSEKGKLIFYYRISKSSYKQYINKKWFKTKDVFETKKRLSQEKKELGKTNWKRSFHEITPTTSKQKWNRIFFCNLIHLVENNQK